MTYCRIVFWNVQKRPIPDRISQLAAYSQADILVLAECEVDSEELVAAFYAKMGQTFQELEVTGKLRIFSRYDRQAFQPHFDSLLGELTIKSVTLPTGKTFLLAALHLPAKIGMSSDSQLLCAARLSQDIIRCEDRIGHFRTLVIGDFNMDPFDSGLTATMAFSAVACQRQLRNRTFRQEQFRAFYNPMWSLFGDRTAGPPGTYFFPQAGVANGWRIIDQVLLRSSMVHAVDSISILETDGKRSLLTNSGIPDTRRASDHLPVQVTLANEKVDSNG